MTKSLSKTLKLCLILLTVVKSVNGVSCPTGSYLNQTTSLCQSCPPGYYCGTTGLHQPTDICSPGYYCKGGATSGTPTDGLTGNICGRGSYCPAGSSEPIPCRSGSFMNRTGAIDDCYNCTAGFCVTDDRRECLVNQLFSAYSNNSSSTADSRKNIIACHAKKLQLMCCPQLDGEEIVFQQKIDGVWRSFDNWPKLGEVYLRSRNRLVSFQNIFPIQTDNDYMCSVVNNPSVAVKMKILLQECKPEMCSPRDPALVQSRFLDAGSTESSTINYHQKTGLNATLTCQASRYVCSDEVEKFERILKPAAIDELSIPFRLRWYKLNKDGRRVEIMNTSTSSTSQSENKYTGDFKSVLRIDNIQPSQFGTYLCSMPDASDVIKQFHVISIDEDKSKFASFIVIPVVLITACLIAWYIRLDIRIVYYVKNYSFNTDCDHDVIVLSSETDSRLAVALGRYLESRFTRKVFLYERDATLGLYKADNWRRGITESSRVLVILSSNFVLDNCSRSALEEAKQLNKQISFCCFSSNPTAADLQFLENDRSLAADFRRSDRKVFWRNEFSSFINFHPTQSSEFVVTDDTLQQQSEPLNEYREDVAEVTVEVTCGRCCPSLWSSFRYRLRTFKTKREFDVFMIRLQSFLPKSKYSNHKRSSSESNII